MIVDICDRTALHRAASNGHEKVVEQLLLAQPQLAFAVDIGGKTALHLAASYGRSKAVAQLLAMSPSLVNIADTYGWTPLHYATSQAHEDIAEMLLAINPGELACAVTGTLDTVLHLAIKASQQFNLRLWKLNLAALHAVNNRSQIPSPWRSCSTKMSSLMPGMGAFRSRRSRMSSPRATGSTRTDVGPGEAVRALAASPAPGCGWHGV